MATPKKIYDTVSKNIVLNVNKYFKDEDMKFRPNHPQRNYVEKTPEATGLPKRTLGYVRATWLLRQVPLLQLRNPLCKHACFILQYFTAVKKIILK